MVLAFVTRELIVIVITEETGLRKSRGDGMCLGIPVTVLQSQCYMRLSGTSRTIPNVRAGGNQDPSKRPVNSQNTVQENNTVTENDICLLSWNSRGSSDHKLEFANHLVSSQVVGNKVPILCNQENFILKANTYRLHQAIPGFHFIINPAVKNVQDAGRPMNRMFICVPDRIKSCVHDVSPGHWRIQSVVISSRESRTLLINTYFPTDQREGEGLINAELTELLAVIENIISKTEFDALVWVGDFNADFSRNSRHTRAVSEAVMESDLKTVWERFPVDFTHTFEREGNTFVSTLDHFFLDEQMTTNVKDAGVIHHPDNASDHEPIYCTLQSITITQSVTTAAPSQPRPSWKRATKEEKEMYNYLLDTRLEHIMIPVQVTECRDMHCQNPEHLQAIDWFAAELMEAIQTAATMSYFRIESRTIRFC